MAAFVASQPLDMRTFFSRTDDEDWIDTSRLPTTFTIVRSDSTTVVTGAFTYSLFEDLPSGGSAVSAMLETWNGSLAWRMTGLNVTIGTIVSFYDDSGNLDDAGFGNRMFAGNDSIVGSAGIDTLLGYGGDDSIAGGSGNDLLMGGTGAS